MISIILVLALLLRIWNLNQSFWLDEAAQVIESARPLYKQFDISADFHPPLYHLLLHFWLYLGRSEIWIRLPSVLMGIGSIYLLYKLGQLLFSVKVGALASFFLSVSAYHIWYSQEARPYMLFVFVSLLSTYFLLKKSWKLYTLSTLLSLYSLYFAPFLILSQLIYVLIKEKREFKNLFITLSICFVLFLPWLQFFIEQLRVGSGGFFVGWKDIVSVSSIKIIPLTFAKFIYGRGSIDNNFIYFLVLLPVILAFIISLYQIWMINRNKAGLVFFFVPLITAWLVSLVMPVVAPQRLIFILPYFYLILAAGILGMRGAKRLICIVLVVIITILGTYDYYINPFTQREKWREATNFVENSGEGIALFVFPEPFAPYIWYKTGKVEALGIAPKFRVEKADLPKLDNKIMAYNKIYLFQYLTGLTDPKKETWNYLQEKGYRETAIKDFPGVGFIFVFEK